MGERVTVEGTVENVIFHNEENGYTVLLLTVEGEEEPVTVVGCIPCAAAGEGMTVTGVWSVHPVHGSQLTAESVERRMPEREEDMIAYLSSGILKGVGPATAQRLVERFGTDTMLVIEQEPERLRCIKGITAQRAKELSDAFRALTGLRQLMEFLARYDLPVYLAMPLQRTYGDGAIQALRDDPYILSRAQYGVDFSIADEIAISLGFDGDDPCRLRAALTYELEHNAANGHVFLPREKLLFATSQLLAVTPDELELALDKLIEGTGLDVRIAYRDDGRPIHLPELKNIRLVPLKAVKYFYNLAVLPAYLRRTHAFYVGLASDMLLTKRSVVVLHDIRPLVMDTDKGFFRFKFWVHCLSTKWFAQRVFTVSDNQRHLISEKLGIPLDKIGITYNGWEHMKGVTPDESIFDKMPGVVKGEYYYALGSLAKHKNFKWIREVARRNPDKTFVVAGGKDLRAFGDDTEAKDTHNVFYPGYVSDAENAALMKHCKLFLHPAVFEGFGIPPLEALALGAPIALANATCLPELYGDTARYFDPYDYDTDLDKLTAQPVAAPDEVLQRYSWDRTANFWLHEIEKYAKQ